MSPDEEWWYEWRVMWAEIAYGFARQRVSEIEARFKARDVRPSLEIWMRGLAVRRHAERVASRELIALRRKHGWAMRGE